MSGSVADEWTVDGSRWDLPFDFYVCLYRDAETSPLFFEHYTDEDIQAWNADEWCFVKATVTPKAKGAVFPGAVTEKSGVEFGFLPGRGRGRKSLEVNHLENLARESVARAQEIIKELAGNRDTTS